MLKERVEILNDVGQKLVDDYEGDWLNFINNGPKKLYANGEGLIERLGRWVFLVYGTSF